MQERKIFVLFLHTSDSMTRIPCPKIDKFSYFYHPSPLTVTLFLKSPYLTEHIKINYETCCIERFSKKHGDVSMTIATSKMELFVALVIRFQLLQKELQRRCYGSTKSTSTIP